MNFLSFAPFESFMQLEYASFFKCLKSASKNKMLIKFKIEIEIQTNNLENYFSN